MTRDGTAASSAQSPAEKARALAARAEADAGIALARFESLHRTRDNHRRRTGLSQMGSDPAAAAPAGWAADRSAMLVTAGSTAQLLTPHQAEHERRQLLWIALAKIVGAVVVAAIGISIGVTIFSGMAG